MGIKDLKDKYVSKYLDDKARRERHKKLRVVVNEKKIHPMPLRYLILSLVTILFVSLSTIFGFFDNPFYTEFRLATPLIIMQFVFGGLSVIGMGMQLICLYINKKPLSYHAVAFLVSLPVMFLNVFGIAAVPMLVASLIIARKKNDKKLLLPLATALSVFAIPVGGFLTMVSWGMATSLDKDETISHEIHNADQAAALQVVPVDKRLSTLTWNIGYGSTGSEMDYFYSENYDGVSGTKGKAWSKDQVSGHMDGILQFLKATQGGAINHIIDANKKIPATADPETNALFNKLTFSPNQPCLKNHNNVIDFMFLQEVDQKSVRSMYFDQVDMISKALPNMDAEFVNNLKVGLLPAPFLDPNGQVDGGVMTLSRYNIEHKDARRYSLNSVGTGLDAIFNLKRAIGYTKYETKNGKTLHMANIHMSAFPEDKEKRDKEYNTLVDLMKKWEAQGDYVVVGGDWNADITEQYFYEKSKNGENSKDAVVKRMAEAESGSPSFLNTSGRTMQNDTSKYNLNLSSLNQFDIAKFPEVFINDKDIASNFVLGTDMNLSHPTARFSAESWNGYEAKGYNKADFSIIDGFIVSKNIEIRSFADTGAPGGRVGVRTIQQGWHKNNLNPNNPYAFADSDHNPVIMNFRLKP